MRRGPQRGPRRSQEDEDSLPGQPQLQDRREVPGEARGGRSAQGGEWNLRDHEQRIQIPRAVQPVKELGLLGEG